jgi:hypothetical protein
MVDMADAAGGDLHGGERSPDGCAAPHEGEVTLPGHEGQFFGAPGFHCQTWIAGVESGVFVVVGSDVAATGDHDCLLARAVRYHVDWGDGACDWTDWFERCDVRLSAMHTYAAPGTYTARVVAEDREGRRTRSKSKVISVTQYGLDLFVQVGGAKLVGSEVTFTESITSYGNVGTLPFEVRYLGRSCDEEIVLDSRTTSLEAGEQQTADRQLTVPSGFDLKSFAVEVDPEHVVPETCPPLVLDGVARPNRANNLAGHSFGFCGVP